MPKKIDINVDYPRIFTPLFKDRRYKGIYGGRGSGKSQFFALLMVVESLKRPQFKAVCIREIQKSIKLSARQNIVDCIERLGLTDLFEIQEQIIKTPGGGLITFQGMQNHTADSVKSLEGFDVAWCEEAQRISARSLKLLRPTIRQSPRLKELRRQPELWFSWNPEHDDDPVDAFLRSKDAQASDDFLIINANWNDNPFFPEDLERERKYDIKTKPDEYAHIWEGAYVTVSDAQVFKGKYTVEDFQTPRDAVFYYGADWGYASDPTCLVRCFIDGKNLYIDYEAYDYHVELNHIPALFSSVPGFDKWTIWGDSARPDIISQLCNQGLGLEPAEKSKIEDGIAVLKGFENIVIHPRCGNTAREFMRYSYQVDKLTEEPIPKFEDKDNHTIDALRYGLNRYIKAQLAPDIDKMEEALEVNAQYF